jgi:hypothetical protein
MKEDQLLEAAELEKLAKIQDLRNDWEKNSNRRAEANAVRRRVQSLLQENEVTLEARRARLRDLLESEKMQYSMESTNTQETALERQSRLRERAKQLREKREADRMAFVADKLEQQFREGCEELRLTVSRRQHDDILAEREDQVRLKAEADREKRQEEEFFAKLWYSDMAAKARREEEDARRQRDANLSTLTVLQQQIAQLEEKKRQEKLLAEEEAQIMREQEELRKLEDEKAAEEKRLSQIATKSLLDQTLKTKRSIEAKRAQEELAFDRKILEQLLEQSKSEQIEQEHRKREIHEEQRRYREYLRQMKEEERKREMELDKLCDAEVEKMWQRRVGQWKIEKMARQKLLEEVMEARRQQLQHKMAMNAARREETKHEREQLLQTIAENKRLDAEQLEKLRRDNASYRSDLLGQINYNERQRHDVICEEQRIAEYQREAEIEYQRKVEYLRDKPVLSKVHPLRRRLYQSAGVQRGAAEMLYT